MITGLVLAIPVVAATDSPTAGWLTIVPLECQEKTGGCNICDITKVFTNAATLISAVLSALSLLMFVVGGLFWIFSGGVESRVETGKKIIIGTVTGLAIVFVAWFAVNIIVRTASLSGGTTTTATVFTKEWWSFAGCYPEVPTTCAGSLVGNVCGGSGDCSGSSYENPRCQCWRELAEGGDDKNCKADGTATVAETGADTQTCACIDGCALLATKTNKAYTCVAESSITDTTKADYSEIRTEITCGVVDSVCVLPK